MNVALEKIEKPVADESGLIQPRDSAMSASEITVELAEENFLNENPDRKLYRRSVAYFFFGFGSNKHSILTDEP